MVDLSLLLMAGHMAFGMPNGNIGFQERMFWKMIMYVTICSIPSCVGRTFHSTVCFLWFGLTYFLVSVQVPS